MTAGVAISFSRSPRSVAIRWLFGFPQRQWPWSSLFWASWLPDCFFADLLPCRFPWGLRIMLGEARRDRIWSRALQSDQACRCDRNYLLPNSGGWCSRATHRHRQRWTASFRQATDRGGGPPVRRWCPRVHMPFSGASRSLPPPSSCPPWTFGVSLSSKLIELIGQQDLTSRQQWCGLLNRHTGKPMIVVPLSIWSPWTDLAVRESGTSDRRH